MRVEFSRAFMKDLRKSPLEVRCALREVIQQIELIESLHTLANCKLLQDSDRYYRLRVRECKVVLLLVEQDGGVFLQRILTRDQIYQGA